MIDADTGIDVDDIVEQCSDVVRERITEAALYHKQLVWNATHGGGTPSKWKSEHPGQSARNIYVVIDKENLRWKVVLPDFYTAFQEFGSKHQAAEPFLRPASMKAIPGILDILNGKPNS